MREFLSFSIESTYIAFGIVTEMGSVVESSVIEYNNRLTGPEIVTTIIRIAKEYHARGISGLTISTAGQVDANRGEILYASEHISDYTGVKLKSLIEAETHIPVEVQNDVNASALAESWLGVAKDVQSLFYLSIGTGVGGSYIIDNKLYAGHSFSAGEIGYLPIKQHYLEDLGSMHALQTQIAEQLNLPLKSVTVADIVSKYEQGETVYVEAVDAFVDVIAQALATIVYILNPELIVIGGEVKNNRSFFQPRFSQALANKLLPNFRKNIRLEIADTLKKTRLVGAVRNFLLQESNLPLRNFLTLVEQKRATFTKRETIIADFILNNMERVPALTISEMAKQVDVSDPTITRFCRKIGVSSFNELKMMAKTAQASSKLYEGNRNRLPFRSIYENAMIAVENELKTEQGQALVNMVGQQKQLYFLAYDMEPQQFSEIQRMFLQKNYIVTSFLGNEAIEAAEKALPQDAFIMYFFRENDAAKQKKNMYQLLQKRSNALGISEVHFTETVQPMITLPVMAGNMNFALTYFFQLLIEMIE
ncbi:ROK family protein [Listeria costaricensis]|uniref:ROK family protein n=1 Tax=Listeria costaricensis TaxID=2026604 RepID=UPI000C0745ED|nr:ROK family protein [Listeria costaricensis]